MIVRRRDRPILKREMQEPISPKPKWKFTEREKVWIREYFKSGFNATAAARVAYGGTPISCRVKGWRKRTKFEAIIEDIVFTRELLGIQGGVDAYLIWLEHGDRQLLEEIERKQREIVSRSNLGSIAKSISNAG